MAKKSKDALSQFYTAKGGSIVTSNHFKGTPAFMKGEILALTDIVTALCKSVGVDPLQVLSDASSATPAAPQPNAAAAKAAAEKAAAEKAAQEKAAADAAAAAAAPETDGGLLD